MPFVLIIIGLVLLISGVRGTVVSSGQQEGLYDLVKGDFTGKDNFFYWFVAIMVIGAIGYIEDLQSLSRAFLALVVIVLFLSNGGFFQKFTAEFFPNTASSL